MAFVDDDEAVVCEDLFGTFAPREALDHGHINDSCGPVLAATDDPHPVLVEPEVLDEPLAPLSEERLPVDQDQRWLAVVGDHCAGGHGLA